MAFDAIQIIMDEFDVEEEVAREIVFAAIQDGRMILDEEEFVDVWIPTIFKPLLEENARKGAESDLETPTGSAPGEPIAELPPADESIQPEDILPEAPVGGEGGTIEPPAGLGGELPLPPEGGEIP